MKPFNLARWIWASNSLDLDDYMEIEEEFISSSKEVELYIASDSVYAIYLNEELIKFIGCSDYPYYKFYDVIKLNVKSVNKLKIQVWHMGFSTSTYINDKHGVIFEIFDKERTILYSSENTHSRVMNEFKNGYGKIITSQQGYSYYYDNTVDKNSFTSSILVDKPYDNFHLRTINNIDLLARKEISFVPSKNSIIIDMKEETAGLLDLDFESSEEQLVTIAYGEHLLDGGVRRFIHDRDFSIEFFASKGNNIHLNPLKRIAGRYIELFLEKPIKINYIGIRPVKYHHELIKNEYKDPLVQRINDVAVRTLELCMHEHYEDCPWREQALYTMDSRNQMLCGYYAFKGYEYQRHNLKLIANGIQKTGLLSICFPCGTDAPIPSFSLHLFQQVYEYIVHTGDKTILDEVTTTLDTILNTFISRLDNNNLVPYFQKPYWNFYEWIAGCSNDIDLHGRNKEKEGQYDFIINAMLVRAVDFYNKIYGKNIDTSSLKQAIRDTFFDKERQVYVLNTNDSRYSQLANSLACLIGLGGKDLINKIVNDKNMMEASLSMRGFVYDALLTEPGYENYVIEDIKTRYKKMLDDGATSFYETELGAADFDNAGSLCHGWSALPVYYFAKLLK